MPISVSALKAALKAATKADDAMDLAKLRKLADDAGMRLDIAMDTPKIEGSVMTLEEMRRAEGAARLSKPRNVRFNVRQAERRAEAAMSPSKRLSSDEMFQDMVRERDRLQQELKYWRYQYDKAKGGKFGKLPKVRDIPRVKYEDAGPPSPAGYRYRTGMAAPPRPERAARSIHEGMVSDRTVSAAPILSEAPHEIFGISNPKSEIIIRRSVTPQTAAKKYREVRDRMDSLNSLISDIEEAGGIDALIKQKKAALRDRGTIGVQMRMVDSGPGESVRKWLRIPYPEYAGGLEKVQQLRRQLRASGMPYKSVQSTEGEILLPMKGGKRFDGIPRAGVEEEKKMPLVSKELNAETGERTGREVQHGPISERRYTDVFGEDREAALAEAADVTIRESGLTPEQVQRYREQLEGLRTIRESVPTHLRGGYDERIRQIEYLLQGK